jgi:hypothetical protein
VLEPFVGDVFVFMNASSSYHGFQYLGGGEQSLQATHRYIFVMVKIILSSLVGFFFLDLRRRVIAMSTT